MPVSPRARVLWAVLVIAAATGLAVTAISFFAAQQMISHRSVRPAVTPADSGLVYDTVPLRARDGTVLEGWWIRPRDGQRRPDLATIVLAHAADGERPGTPTGKASMLRHAAWLSRAGFIVLAFDFRSYGGSEGHRTSGGYLEQQDLAAAIRLAHERALGAPVAVLGEGMGATVALAVASQDPSVVGVVADSPGMTWSSALWAGAPWWARLGVPGLVERLAARGPTDYPAGAPAPLVGGRSPNARLLIFGAQDHHDGKADQNPSAARLRAYDTAPAENRERTLKFFQSAIQR